MANDKEKSDIEKKPIELEDVNKNVIQVREMMEIAEEAFGKYTEMKVMESDNNLKQHEISDKTARFMYMGDRIVLIFLIALVAVASFLGNMPSEMFWTVLLMGIGYFVKDTLQSIGKKKES